MSVDTSQRLSPFRRLLRATFVRFLVVGALNSTFGYGVFVALVKCGLHYSAALLLATVIGVLFNYKTTGRLVFRSRVKGLLLRFVGVYALVYAVNVASMKLLLVAGVGTLVSGAALLLPMAALSYILNKNLVFYHAQND